MARSDTGLDEGELGALAEMAFLEVRDRHSKASPPVSRNELILYMSKQLSVPVVDAKSAVELMENDHLRTIAMECPNTYMIEGRKVNPTFYQG